MNVVRNSELERLLNVEESGGVSSRGSLIINADDWGRDRETTEKIVDCARCGTISSVSAMVFMKDSERAANLAREQGIDAGLHLNLTTPFTAPAVPTQLVEHQQKISRYLNRRRFSPVVFHPGLARSFEYVVNAQLEEFRRIYGGPADHIDGHHHMHLCANVLLGHLLPAGTKVRRNFSFWPGEKSWGNRTYRKLVDHTLSKRHQLTDFFFDLSPVANRERLQKIFSLAGRFHVEVETHPVVAEEYRFLTEGGIFPMLGDFPISSGFLNQASSRPAVVQASEKPAPVEITEVAHEDESVIICSDDLILITGANGFVGSKVVENLLERGFRNLRCFARHSGNANKVETLRRQYAGKARIEVLRGNLLSAEDCAAATRDAKVIFHLAAGRGEKSYPDAFANSVVTTRNLLEGCLRHQCLRRFVNVSSFAVYSNQGKPQSRLLDESCPIDPRPEQRGEAYVFAKVKQDEILAEYGEKFALPYVIVRPGYVYGPGNESITDRVGIDTFGIFLHCGGSNSIPFTYVDNCADAIVMAGLKPGIDGEAFNVVDDDLPTSRRFLRLYKRNVQNFRSLYMPHALSFALSYLWEQYSIRSQGQLPPSFNRGRWHSYWKKTRYSNAKLKARVGWRPVVSTSEGLNRYFASCRKKLAHA